MKMKVLLIGLAGMLAGCGTMLQGTMYRLDNGAAWPFGIAMSYGTGALQASDPQSGETFTGQYTGTYSDGGSSFGSWSGTGFSGGQMVVMSGSGTQISPPTKATARGILRGTNGTVIEVYLDIRPGIRPKGHGQGQDNKGRRFQIQF